MNRSSFIKSLFIASISPKILGQLNIDKAPIVTGSTANLFAQLNALRPTYYKQFMEKYSNESYIQTMNQLYKTNNQ